MNNSGNVCPYVDRRDARCAGPLTLLNLREAFRLCAGDHDSCDVYHQIRSGDAWDFFRHGVPRLASA